MMCSVSSREVILPFLIASTACVRDVNVNSVAIELPMNAPTSRSRLKR
jgi:hypothetical protein